jgi:streptomycin 6-kinase
VNPEVTADAEPAPIPDRVIRSTLDIHGERGAAWLEDLPALLARCASRWELRILPPFDGLVYTYVAPAVRSDGTPAVLKVGVPCDDSRSEIDALTLWSGDGICRLLESDREKGVLLLERLEPGDPLGRVGEHPCANAIAASVLERLWRPAPAEISFRTVGQWTGLEKLRRHFDGGTGPLPTRLVEEAETLFSALLSSGPPPIMLHGDLHFGNILSAKREPWLAIDPKGLVGDPAYDAVVVVLNHLPEGSSDRDGAAILSRRIDELSERLDLDRSRLRAWSLTQAVISAWWMIGDHGAGWEGAIRVAELTHLVPT